MNAHVGHGSQPVGELGVQVVEVAERPAKEEVLADVAERPLHLALGLRPVGPAGFRVKAVMAGEVEQRAVVDDAAFRCFTDDGGLHPVVEDFLRHAVEVGERCDVAAQDRLQVLMQDEARPQPPARSEHQREQPDDSRHVWFIGELHLELGEVDLRLATWRGLETDPERRARGRPDRAQEVGHRGITAVVAEGADLPQQTPAAQLRIGGDPLLQIRLVRIEAARLRRSRPIDRRLQAVGDVSADGLRILARLPGDRGNGHSLSMKVEYHHELPNFDHRRPPVVP
jgi:hypothetical protein